jgi:hypothetical protein
VVTVAIDFWAEATIVPELQAEDARLTTLTKVPLEHGPFQRIARLD